MIRNVDAFWNSCEWKEREINIREQEETIMLKGIIGTRVCGDKLAMNKYGMERERTFLAKTRSFNLKIYL